MRYFLIGYKSCGKTTMGKKLADRMGLKFIDLDHFIEAREGKTVPQIYTEVGDEGFRQKEWEALLEVVKQDDMIVSLGGGAPCHCDNMNLIEKHGEVIYIHLDNHTLVNRLRVATKDRPIVLNKSEEELQFYIKDIRGRCEHHYTRAKYIVEGQDITVDKILEVIGQEQYIKA